jgi:hypothetical protein
MTYLDLKMLWCVFLYLGWFLHVKSYFLQKFKDDGCSMHKLTLLFLSNYFS